MSWSSSLMGMMALGLGAFAPAARAANGGRLDLLAREAADVVATPAAAGPAGTGLFLGAVVVVAVLASILGTWIGLRSQSVARIRERDGWRELSYRFRAPGKLKADPGLITRLATVLDDLEDLGRRMRAVPTPAVAGTGPLPAADIGPPVRFQRTGETEGVRARWIPDAKAAPVPEAPRPVRVVAAAAPPAPAPPAASHVPVRQPAESRGSRQGTYRDARRLLAEGADRETVRARTGLKLAEIDLLRCAPGERP